MCLCIFHLLISQLDQQCHWSPHPGGSCQKIQVPGWALPFFPLQFPGKGSGHVLQATPPQITFSPGCAMPSCSVCTLPAINSTYTINSLHARMFWFIIPPCRDYAVWPCKHQFCPLVFLRLASTSSSHGGPSVFLILQPCFPQWSNALMGQICSLDGKHVGPCQKLWEPAALHCGHLVPSWGCHPESQVKGCFQESVV